jgi:hypothetical protein
MNRQLKQMACQWMGGLRSAAQSPDTGPYAAGWTQFHQRAVAHHDVACEAIPVGKYDPAAARSHKSVGQFWVFVVTLCHAFARRAIPLPPEDGSFSRSHM